MSKTEDLTKFNGLVPKSGETSRVYDHTSLDTADVSDYITQNFLDLVYL